MGILEISTPAGQKLLVMLLLKEPRPILLLKLNSMLQKLIAEKNGTHGTLPLLLNGLLDVNHPLPLLTKAPKEEVLSSVSSSVASLVSAALLEPPGTSAFTKRREMLLTLCS